MTKPLAKIIIFFICGLILYNSLGYYWAFAVIRKSHQKNTWKSLPYTSDNQTVKFIFDLDNPDSSFEFVNNHEIRIMGRMYDIVRKKHEARKIIFFCIKDLKEDNLIARYNESKDEQPGQRQRIAGLIAEKIIKTATIVNFTNVFFNYFAHTFHIKLLNEYTSPDISIFPPPPQ